MAIELYVMQGPGRDPHRSQRKQQVMLSRFVVSGWRRVCYQCRLSQPAQTEAERATLNALSPEEQGDYLDKRRPLRSNDTAHQASEK
jgi:hypothetical protein